MRALTTLIAPFLPVTGERCARMLNVGPGWEGWSEAVAELPAGHGLNEPVILVKKLDLKEGLGD